MGCSGKDAEVVGVLAMSVDLGEFNVLEKQLPPGHEVVLIDLRQVDDRRRDAARADPASPARSGVRRGEAAAVGWGEVAGADRRNVGGRRQPARLARAARC